MNFIIQILMVLVYVAIVYLILYLFQKYVVPFDQKVLGIIIFVVAALLIIWAISGHTLIFWR
jgi:hypothetical protein